MARLLRHAKASPVTPAPTLTGVSPDFGLVAGGAVVTLTGTNFTAGGGLSSAHVNGQALTGLVVDSPTSAHGTAPPATGGTAVADTTASATGPGGTATLANAWAYLPGTPSLLLVSDLGVTGAAPITKWADQSGTGNDFNKNATPGATLVAGVLNGKPAVRFARASSNQLQLGDGTNTNPWTLAQVMSAAAYTEFLVFNPTSSIDTDSANAFSNDAVLADANGFFGYHLRATGPTAQAYHWDGAEKDALQSPATLGTPYYASVTYDGTDIRHYKNGANVVSKAAGNISAVAGNMRLGFNASAIAYFNGDVMAVIAYQSRLSDADRLVVEKWLSRRYALPAPPPLPPGTQSARYVASSFDSATETWIDQSGNNRDLPTGNGAPTRNASGGPNNNPYVHYAAGVDASRRTTPTLAQPYTRVLVLRQPTALAAGYVADANTANAGAIYAIGDGTLKLYDGANNLIGGGTYAANAWFAVRAEFNGATSKIAYGGVATSGDLGASTSLDGETINPSTALVLDVAEEIIYPRILSAGELTQLNAYLLAVHGVTF